MVQKIYFLKRLNFEIVFKYTLTAIFLFVALFQKFPVIKIRGTFVSIRIEDFILLFGFIVAFFYAISGKTNKNSENTIIKSDLVKNNVIPAIFLKSKDFILSNKIYRLYAIFLLVGFTSLLNGVYLLKTVELNLGLLHFLRRIEYFTPFILGFELFRIGNRKRNSAYFLNLILIVLFLVFLYGFGQKHFGFPVIVTQNQEYSQGVALKFVEGSHLNSTFAGHYDLASTLIVFLPILLCMFFFSKRFLNKLLIASLFIGGLWLLVNSASRISFVTILVSETVALILAKRKKFIPLVLSISIVFIVASSNLVDRYERFINVYTERIEGFISENIVLPVYAQEPDDFKRLKATPTPTPIPVYEDRSTSIRLNVEWPRAVRAFAKNPLLGTGYSSIDLATDNGYLRLLGEVGLLGFYAFFLFWLNIILLIKKSLPKFFSKKEGVEKAIVCGVFASIPAIFLNLLFIDLFEASKFATLFWMFLGIAVSLVYKHNYE